MIIGLAGKRQVGKSHIADHLVRNFGFSRVHPFDGGKAACRGYFTYLGADEDTARRMTDGDLKDMPSPLLPVICDPEHGVPGTHYAPRFYMEKSGQFHGVQLGPEWTIGADPRFRPERRGPGDRYVIESIVYEAEELHRLGGIIIRIDRPDTEGPAGVMSDRVGAAIVPDFVFCNEEEGLDRLYENFDAFLAREVGLHREDPDYAI